MDKIRNRKVSQKTIVGDIAAMLKEKSISDQAIDLLVSEAYAEFWSQDHAEKAARGKYEECLYWTRAAKEKWLEIKKSGQRPGGDSFVSEHVVPRKTLVVQLLKLRARSAQLNLAALAQHVEALFSKYCLACIVLKNGDDLLPREFPESADTDWGRYQPVQTINFGSLTARSPQPPHCDARHSQ